MKGSKLKDGAGDAMSTRLMRSRRLGGERSVTWITTADLSTIRYHLGRGLFVETTT